MMKMMSSLEIQRSLTKKGKEALPVPLLEPFYFVDISQLGVSCKKDSSFLFINERILISIGSSRRGNVLLKRLHFVFRFFTCANIPQATPFEGLLPRR